MKLKDVISFAIAYNLEHKIDAFQERWTLRMMRPLAGRKFGFRCKGHKSNKGNTDNH